MAWWWPFGKLRAFREHPKGHGHAILSMHVDSVQTTRTVFGSRHVIDVRFHDSNMPYRFTIAEKFLTDFPVGHDVWLRVEARALSPLPALPVVKGEPSGATAAAAAVKGSAKSP